VKIWNEITIRKEKEWYFIIHVVMLQSWREAEIQVF